MNKTDVIHAYGAEITAADVRAALTGVSLDTESPDGLQVSDGLRSLLYRLGVSAGRRELPEDSRLAWVAAASRHRMTKAAP